MSDAPARESASESVFLALRQQIMSGELPPGSRHSIYSLADILGVSRTPVREAVLRLADLHLVTIEKNRGVVVRSVREEEIAALFEMRFIVEDAAVRVAARRQSSGLSELLERHQQEMGVALRAEDEPRFLRADRGWHEAIVNVLQNPWAHRQILQLRYATPPSADRETSRVDRLTNILVEHDAVQQALVSGSVEAASAAVQAHLVATARSLVEPAALAGQPRDWPVSSWAVTPTS